MSVNLQYILDERQQICDTCGRSFKPKGFDSHRRAYHSKPEDAPGHTIDDIRTEFHPHARIATRPPRPECQPWLPFRCQLDFEVAELAHEAALTHEQTTRLIRMVRCSRTEDFTLANYADVRNMWEAASHRLMPDTITVLLGDKDMEYTVHFRPLWEWAVDLLRHPIIGPHCVFNAQRLSKFDGDSFIQFIDEPWTVDAFWECQSQMPPDVKPLAFILYADKAKLLSFGREKGYPVIARLANLPVAIRNGKGLGGGRVVGWLPLIKDDPKHKDTQRFANFRAAVWHAAFKKVLASIVPPSTSGRWVNCWDNIVRLFYTLVLILSADYEEQAIMSLTRGIMSNFPCPICLIPEDKLSSIMLHNYPLRTGQATSTLLIKARAEHRKGRREAILKSQAIRDVDNAFHDMNHKTTDVHCALSYDCLHVDILGFFGDHMWSKLQLLIGLLGRDKVAQVDENFDGLPCWRNLIHFDAVMAITFTDGSKYEVIFKLLAFAAHAVLPNAGESKLAYLLLWCICAYLEVDRYATLEVHTTMTIAAGREALQEFSELMDKYIKKSEAVRPDKNWSFPKKHLVAHLFDDIIAKGATRNYNTMLNEKCHGPLKASYQYRTNFKDVAPQILRTDHWSLVSEFIRSRVDELDAYNTQMAEDETDPDTNVPSNFHVRFGSKQPKKSLETTEEQHVNNPSFRHFRRKLNAFLNALPAVTQHVNMLPFDNFRFLKVNYESLVDFCQTTDYLFRRRLQKDKHMKFWRVRQRGTVSEFILAELIIRGVALAPDPTTVGDFLVMDTIDSDIFLCMKQMHLAAGH
ncbi:hypothetical protein BD769DRAFT_1657222 [Suillus cothurnatus]|nr:hypothetical protein BD769DRAFT_1657222 [Suillus cothurnatus]